jgi:hypothetical protein
MFERKPFSLSNNKAKRLPDYLRWPVANRRRELRPKFRNAKNENGKFQNIDPALPRSIPENNRNIS